LKKNKKEIPKIKAQVKEDEGPKVTKMQLKREKMEEEQRKRKVCICSTFYECLLRSIALKDLF
jgi:hypothetical protein